MKLRNFRNLSFEKINVGGLSSDSRDRFCFYYWVLLIIPSLIIFLTTNAYKLLLMIPMLVTAVLSPHGQKISDQLKRIKKSASILLLFIVIHSTYQGFFIKLNFDKILVDIISAVVCLYILNIENLEIEEEEIDKAAQKERLQESSHKISRVGHVFNLIQIVSLTGFLKYQPSIMFTLAIMEIFVTNNVPKYSKFFRLAITVFSAFFVFPECANNSSYFSHTVLVSVLIGLCTYITNFTFMINFNFRDYQYERKIIRDSESFWKFLKKFPNFIFIIDRFWSFLLPIPIVVVFWSMASFSGVIEPSILGLTAVLISCSVIVQVHWCVVRYILSKVSQMIIMIFMLTFMLFESPSMDRFYKTLLLISMLQLSSFMVEIYKIVLDKNQSDPLPVLMRFYAPPNVRIYTDAVQKLWTSASPLLSSLLLAYLTLESLHSKVRLVLMAFTFTCGLFARTNEQFFWGLVQVYVIIEQVYLLFLSQKTLPAELNPLQTSAVFKNVAILVIAEFQRLNSIPSIFSGDYSTSKVGDCSDKDKIKPNTFSSEIMKADYENSFLWASIKFSGKCIKVVSLLGLMGVILFYPQMVEVSFQTCVYSLWACFFAFLFYRPNVTARLEFICIGILAISSATFFIHDLYILSIHELSNFWSILFDSTGKITFAGRSLVLHSSLLCFSFTSLFAMKIDEVSEIENEEQQQKQPNSMEDSPRTVGAKLINEAGSILERLFVAHWTRLCALLSFLAASFNPSIFGVIHVLIGCSLAWKNIPNTRYYFPMILWLLCSTFLPAIFYRFTPEPANEYVPLLVGSLDSMKSTICLTLWAMILFLQPVFMRCLLRLTTENDRENGLVSFQILPQEENSLSTRNFESFENSARYYISNWFLEFHNEIMVAVLLIGSVSRKNFYGIIYAFLTIIHAILPIFGRKKSIELIAKLSFFLQLLCFFGEYLLAIIVIYESKFPIVAELKANPNFPVYAKFFGLSGRAYSLIVKSILVGMYVLLTVRWYLTSRYYQEQKPTRRFDSHWCRLCNQVGFKSKHAYSKIKYNIHLYLGWASHACLFFTAVQAYDKPTIPSVLLLIFALVFFFYGEASILTPKLRNNVFLVFGIILSWILADSLISALLIFIIDEDKAKLYWTSDMLVDIFCYTGLTNVKKFIRLDESNFDRHAVFENTISKIGLGITIFLLQLQIRLYYSKAWPFVLARLYHSYATATKRAELFSQNLQATIVFQQKNLEKITDKVKKQFSHMAGVDISDWKKLSYVPDDAKAENENVSSSESHIPSYGHNEDDGIRQRSGSTINEFRTYLNESSISNNNQHHENDHLDNLNNDQDDKESVIHPLKIKAQDFSAESLATSDDTARIRKKELEANFYYYTFYTLLKSIVKFLLESSQEYRRLQNRPSRKSSLRLIFNHPNWVYRVQFLLQLSFDALNANFDFVLDFLVMDAQFFHSSGFSLVMVIGILMLARLQRPYTSKTLHNRMLIICAFWIIFNFCKIVLWKYLLSAINSKESEITLVSKTYKTLKNTETLFGQSILHRILGIHIHGQESISCITFRPTLILLALSYKRSLMRQLGLWDYGRGIKLAQIYYKSEEDLDEINELNVPDEVGSDTEEEESAFNETISNSEDEDDADSVFSSSIESSIKVSETSETGFSIYATTWKELLWPVKSMPWRDFYVPMFLADFVCLFLFMYYWGDFTLGADQNGYSRYITKSSFWDMIFQNMVPNSLLHMLILNSFVLALDRALYVSKNYLGKFILQIVSLIGYHIYLFFYLPRFYSNPDILNLVGIRVWYFFKWVYWISSALQLKYDYPPLRTEPFLGSDYGIFGAYLHTMYRALPFIDELKTIIDWSMTPSALGIWPWLKLSDIYERLYSVQCNRAFQAVYYGRHQFGAPADQFSKTIQGVVFVTMSVFLLWSPLLILGWSAMMGANTVKSFRLEVSIDNYGPPFLTFIQDRFEPISLKEDFEKFRYKEGVNPFEADPGYFTKVVIPEASQIPWNITESTRYELIKHLNDPDANPRIKVRWIITRAQSQTAPIIEGSFKDELNKEARENLAYILDPKTDNKFMTTAKVFKLIPSLIKAPLTENSTALETLHFFDIVKICPKSEIPGTLASTPKGASATEKTKRIVQLLRHNIQVAGRNKILLDKVGVSGSEGGCQFYLANSRRKFKEKLKPIEIMIYSPKVPKYQSTSLNFVGLYMIILFSVYPTVKMMHADMTTRIQYDDLPNPLPLLVMCQQILMMRELGDFVTEESIYWQLIEILRNPQLLIEITRK